MSAVETSEQSQTQELPENRTVLLIGSNDAKGKEHFSNMENLLNESAGESNLPFKVINPNATLEQVAEKMDSDVENSSVKRIANLTDLKDINQATGLSVVILPSESEDQTWSESPDAIRKLSIAFLKGDNVDFQAASQNEDGTYSLTPIPKEDMKEAIQSSEGMKDLMKEFQTPKAAKGEAKGESAAVKGPKMPEAESEGESTSVKM
jgi:hypothetical protein